MSPSLEPDDFVLASRWHFSLKQNDIVVVKHPKYHDIIKRIDQVNTEGRVWLKGDNEKASVSSEQMGWVNKEQIKGKVIYNIRKKRV